MFVSCLCRLPRACVLTCVHARRAHTRAACPAPRERCLHEFQAQAPLAISKSAPFRNPHTPKRRSRQPGGWPARPRRPRRHRRRCGAQTRSRCAWEARPSRGWGRLVHTRAHATTTAPPFPPSRAIKDAPGRRAPAAQRLKALPPVEREKRLCLKHARLRSRRRRRRRRSAAAALARRAARHQVHARLAAVVKDQAGGDAAAAEQVAARTSG